MPKNAQTTAQLHSSHTLVMLNIVQARLQQYVNCELPDVQAGFRKGRGTRDQIAYIWAEKHLVLLYWLCQSLCVDHNKLWKILKEMGIPDHLTCLLRNLYAGQEATVRTGHGRLVPHRKRSTSRLYIVTLLIQLICRVHHEKHWAGSSTSWNQDCREKYQ